MNHTVALVTATLLASGCAHGLGWVGPLSAEVPRDAEALDAAVEAYFTATDAAGLRAAVAKALEAAPKSAAAHEIAADLARLDEDLARQVDHILAALADTNDDAPFLHLRWLSWIELTTPERRRVVARASQLARGHADPAVRAAAAATAVRLLAQDANYGAMKTLLAEVVPSLDLAMIGTWDNDQGKGFDTVRPPEEGIDLAARYPGTVVEVGWRTSPPKTRQGTYDLDSLFSPGDWATAYATAVLHAAKERPYELRLATTSPFKIWLNGQLVASVEERRAVLAFDGFIVPLALRPGPNRLLVKLAQRKGSWDLRSRVTGPGGAQAVGLRVGDPGLS
ncbi:MAG: hypothetical protein QF464_15740, partial [Myxococcota bacterium]|nr:hypothetical protein [Myxococcota bacterium]